MWKAANLLTSGEAAFLRSGLMNRRAKLVSAVMRKMFMVGLQHHMQGTCHAGIATTNCSIFNPLKNRNWFPVRNVIKM
jgi:hypothetical protein